MEYSLGFKNKYTVLCLDKDGNYKWREEIHNLVPTEGLNYVINSMFRTGLSVPSLYVGLITGPAVLNAADTMVSHSGWTELTDYAESARFTCTFTAAAAGSTSNAGAISLFSINNTVTMGGIFVCLGSAVKGGSDGVIMGEALLSADKDLISGDQVFGELVFTIASL